MEDQGQKRASAGDGGPPEKRLKGEAEDTEVYSQRIKRKLQSNSRTGQACDRCKERKMKCDSNPDGCQPCQSKDMICKSTDRITGQAHERGETSRLKKEVADLKVKLSAYQHHFDLQNSPQYPAPGPYQEYISPNGYSSNPPQPPQMPMMGQHTDAEAGRPNNADGPYTGPIHQTLVDFVDGEIDIGAFDCPDMEETTRISAANMPLTYSRHIMSILGAQKPEKPPMPTREETLQYIDNFQNVIAPYVPIVHGPTFRKQVVDFYDNPTSFDHKPAEIVTITVVLAIFAHQMAIRNPPMRQEKLAESNRLYDYSLSFFPELLQGDSLADMQALALFLVQARNLPKPGNSWRLSSMVLARAIELNYHRSSKKVMLPPEQQNPLAIELRKRVFWSILGIQVTTAVKMGRPMAISPQDMDVELPLAILDSEITEQGFLPKSGNCDFWAHIYLSKKLPILMDLYHNVIVLRKSGAEYVRVVKELDAQIINWRREWDKDTALQSKNGSFRVATHLVDIWYAEFRIILHHPHLCTSQAAEVHKSNLDICMEASKLVLRNVVSMVQDFRGADFTWHFVSGYVLAMGMAMHVYNKRREHLNTETFNKMKIELQGWLFVIKSADHFMNSGDYLYRIFHPRVQQCLEDAQNVVTASEALRNGYHHGAQPQQAAEADSQQPTYSTAETYAHPAIYSDTVSTNTMPTTTAAAPSQQQSYNTHPPPPPPSTVASSAAQQPLKYHENNTGYHIPLSQPSSYSRHHDYPPPQVTTSMYPSAVAYQAPGPDHANNNYAATTSATDVYSMSQGVWPAVITQYQNSQI